MAMTEEPEYRLPTDFRPDLEIEVTFLRPEEGGGTGPWLGFRRNPEEGRAGAWRPGFTPPFCYDETFWIAFYLFTQEVIHPGDKVKGLVHFISPEFHDHHRKHLHPGKQIELRDPPSRAVARGHVTKLISLAQPGTT
jgi:hypothetical protein